MQTDRHMPRIITQAFSPAPCALCERVPDRLRLPEHPAEKCPLIVRITSGEDVSPEAERLVNEGFAVYTFATEQRTAERDLRSCETLRSALEEKLDALLREYPALDAGNVFVDGWLAAYLIFHTQRFRAAIQRPALINPSTAYGNCAAGWVERFGTSLEEMMLALAERSVLADVDNCKTPCLILYTEGERYYSREQSEQLYAAIKDRDPDVDCRMAVFTARQWETHGLQEIVNWWKRFAQEAEDDK